MSFENGVRIVFFRPSTGQGLTLFRAGGQPCEAMLTAIPDPPLETHAYLRFFIGMTKLLGSQSRFPFLDGLRLPIVVCFFSRQRRSDKTAAAYGDHPYDIMSNRLNDFYN